MKEKLKKLSIADLKALRDHIHYSKSVPPFAFLLSAIDTELDTRISELIND